MQNSDKQSKKIANLFGTFPGSQKSAPKKPSSKQIKDQYQFYRILNKSITNTIYRASQVSSLYLDIKNHIKIMANQVTGLQDNLNKFNSNKQQQFPNTINSHINQLLVDTLEHSHENIASIFSDVAKSMNIFVEMYSGVIKKKYTKFVDDTQNFEHYRDKVNQLSGSSEFNKIQRNRNKLLSAQKEYEEVSLTLHNDLTKIIDEGCKILINSYASSFVTLLQQYDRTKVSTQSILKQKPNTDIDFFDINNLSQQSIQLNDGKSSFNKVLKETLIINPKTVKLKSESISLYFKNLSFSPTKKDNPFEQFDTYHSKNQNQGRQKAKSFFHNFHNVFGHQKKKEQHHHLNQLHERECQTAVRQSKIKIKSVVGIDTKPNRDSNDSYADSPYLSVNSKKQGQMSKSSKKQSNFKKSFDLL